MTRDPDTSSHPAQPLLGTGGGACSQAQGCPGPPQGTPQGTPGQAAGDPESEAPAARRISEGGASGQAGAGRASSSSTSSTSSRSSSRSSRSSSSSRERARAISNRIMCCKVSGRSRSRGAGRGGGRGRGRGRRGRLRGRESAGTHSSRAPARAWHGSLVAAKAAATRTAT